ncbi:HEAT repeat domain-containing protein [Intestinibacter sp.]|uniref:HEAT repeat domain-containing protein n=1 Tax=Intestinibacter sp. TaxID=1965304 RepID=UPI002A74972A|nr:HEAT repeat domain-containing protein [Intestinibacter sp.]MDY2734867.1 HEAT repeat domain-containing protein [Intestinibacter sp.]
MGISWSNIDNLEDYFITYLLYTESKTVSQISRIRNIPISEVNDQLIKAKLEIKSANKQKIESSKDVLDKFLELGKDSRLEFMENLSLDQEKELNFKRELYKRILKEKNADDLIVLIWATGETRDDRFLKILHPLTNHRHSDVRRITYSAIRKISSSKSKAVLEKGLYDSNPQTRQYCAKALAKVGDDKTVDILQRLIKNKKANEKEYVIRAYNEAILALKYLTAGGEKCYEDV